MSDPGYGQGRPDYPTSDQGQTYPTPGYPGYQQQQQPPQQATYQAGAGYGPGYGQAAGYGSGYPTPAGQSSSSAISSKGFFGSLFDVSFDSFITPTIIKIVYILAMVGVGLGTLFLAFDGFAAFGVGGGLAVLVIACPLFFFFSLLLTRIYMELIMVIFRLAGDIRIIRDRGGLS